jgi:hypothetical protein
VLFIAPQIRSTFDGSSLPAARSAAAIEGRSSGTKRSFTPTPYQVLPRQTQKQQRMYLGTQAANANAGRPRPPAAEESPAVPPVANSAAQAGPFICVSDFVAKCSFSQWLHHPAADVVISRSLRWDSFPLRTRPRFCSLFRR